MKPILITQATLVSQGRQRPCDLLLQNGRIARIDGHISHPTAEVWDVSGHHVFAGMIDDQVHFREPGFPHKATIASESRAAVLGGITSYMDMPNTRPHTLTRALLEEKYERAAATSVANYSFFMGIASTNLEEALRVDNRWVCGITDDGLYFDDEQGILANQPAFLEELFARAETLVALHSEDDGVIARNTRRYEAIFGDDIPMAAHECIRSEEACLVATRRVVDLARRHGNRLHLFHISTAAECALFDDTRPVREKRITAEACLHHLRFNHNDYARLGSAIKWNPSVKSRADQEGLAAAFRRGAIDFFATDHAPHVWSEKAAKYAHAASGGPLVQHAVPAALELFHEGKLTLPQVAAAISEHVSAAYRLVDRGVAVEGAHADLIVVDLNRPWQVTRSSLAHHCGWSPFEGAVFQSQIRHTFTNGLPVVKDGVLTGLRAPQRLEFEVVR